MRMLMIGAGAVGGYFGGRLAQAGHDVTFLVREARAAQLAGGLHLHSPHGDAVIHLNLLLAPALKAAPQPFDAVLVSTKSYSLEAAMNDFAPAVRDNTAVVPLLNGMRHLDLLSARFGALQVLGGSVRIIADMNETGAIDQLTPLGELTFGPRADVASQADRFDLEAMRQALSAPGFVTILASDAVRAMWQKWWILASMNAISILAGGSLGQAFRTPHGPAFVRGVLAECTGIAERNGYPPDPTMLAEHLARLTDPASPLTTSMFRDMTRGLPVEADQIFGDLLHRATGLEAPRIEAAFTRLKVYEAERTSRSEVA